MEGGPYAHAQLMRGGGGYHRLKVKQDNKKLRWPQQTPGSPTGNLPSTGLLGTLNGNISCISGPAECPGLTTQGETGDARLSLEKEAVVVGMPLI